MSSRSPSLAAGDQDRGAWFTRDLRCLCRDSTMHALLFTHQRRRAFRMKARTFLLSCSLGLVPFMGAPFTAADVRILRDGCVTVDRDPGNLPVLELRADRTFRIAATPEDLTRSPLLTGSWAFTSNHLMMVIPPGGCASAPKLERVVAVFVQLDKALYPAMSSSATHATTNGNPQTGCPAYDAAVVETYRPLGEAASSPVGVWQGHRTPGAFCTGTTEL